MITDEDRVKFLDTHKGWLKKIPGIDRWVCADPAFPNDTIGMYDTAREALDPQILNQQTANQRKEES